MWCTLVKFHQEFNIGKKTASFFLSLVFIFSALQHFVAKGIKNVQKHNQVRSLLFYM